MADGWTTMADVFNPLDAALRAQQIQQSRQQGQMNQLAIQQAQQEMAKREAFQHFVAGQQGPMPNGFIPGTMPQPQMQSPVQEASPPAPQITPEQREIMLGQTKIASIMPDISRLFDNPETNGEAINKVNAMQKSDAQIQAALKAEGYDDVSIGYDEKNNEAWQKFTKTWSKQELESIGRSIPGGAILAELPAGKYTIDYDPINKRIRPSVQSVSVSDDKSYTGETKLIRESLRDKLGREPKAGEILEEQQRLAGEKEEAKYGEVLSPETSRMFAEMYLAGEKLPPMARDRRSMKQIMEEVYKMAKEKGISVDEMRTERTRISATQKSYTKMKQMNDADVRYANELYTDIDRLKNSGLIERIRGNAPRLLNMSRRKLRDAIASKQFLGDELVLAQELDGIMNEFARISLGTTDSIADLSEGSKAKYQELINPDRPSFAIIRQLDQIRKSTEDRLTARAKTLSDLEKQLSYNAGKGTPMTTSTTKRMTFNPATGRIE